MTCALDTVQDFLSKLGIKPPIGKNIFFTKSCHLQTYPNYEQPPQRLQNFDFQCHFPASKIGRNILKKIFEKYLTRSPTFIYKIISKIFILK